MRPARVPKPATLGGDLDAPYEAKKAQQRPQGHRAPPDRGQADRPAHYLTVDVRLDALLDLRKQLNSSLEADGVKLSVNDLLIKALARALHARAAVQCQLPGRRAVPVHPRGHLGRGRCALWPDHPDHHRCGYEGLAQISKPR